MKIRNHNMVLNLQYILRNRIILKWFQDNLWFLIFIKARFEKCDGTRIVDIFGEEVAKS